MQSTSSEEHSGRKLCFCRNLCILFFSDFQRKILLHWAKNFWKVSRNCFLLVQRIILGIFIWSLEVFFGFRLNVFGYWGNYIQQGCKNNILRFPKNILGKMTRIFIFIGLSVTNFQLLSKNFSEAMSKFHSMCPEERFGEKFAFWKPDKFINFFVFWVKSRFVKTAFYVSRRKFRK